MLCCTILVLYESVLFLRGSLTAFLPKSVANVFNVQIALENLVYNF